MKKVIIEIDRRLLSQQTVTVFSGDKQVITPRVFIIGDARTRTAYVQGLVQAFSISDVDLDFRVIEA